MVQTRNLELTQETVSQIRQLCLLIANNSEESAGSAKTLSFSEFTNEWFSIRVDNGFSAENTVSYYRNLLDQILKHFGSMTIDQIRPMDIEKYLNGLAHSYAPATIHHHYRVLRCIFNYAEINGFVQQNIMNKVRVLGQSRTALRENIDFLAVEEAQRFLKELEKAPLRWRCMMLLFMLVGIRRGEACGLMWRDIDFDLATLSVSRNVTYSPRYGVQVGALKTPRSRRTLPLPRLLLQNLFAWKAEQFSAVGPDPTAFVFSKKRDPHTPLFPSAPTKWLARFTETYNLPPISPHDLRHTCGTLMLAAGASVKEVQDTLGHTDASITLNYYVGTDEKALRLASGKLVSSLGIA